MMFLLHWLSVLNFGYLWPSLKGNGPEALAQTVVYGTLALYFVPKVRAWVNRHVDGLHAKLDVAHKKMDHIIKHSNDIPEFKEDHD
jgi:hypothetical protein